MQASQQQMRENIEDEIEQVREVIHQHRQTLWWFTFGVYAITLGFLAAILVWSTPLLHIIFCQWVSALAVAVVLAGIVIVCITLYEEMRQGHIIAHPGYHEIFNTLEHLRIAKKTAVKLRHRLAQYDKRLSNQLPTPEQHVDRLPSLIASYRRQANRYKRRFFVVQITIIILSVAVTSLSGGWLDRYVLLPWAIPVGSGLVSLLSTFLLLFKFKEKGANLQETADAMDLEFKACGLRLPPYDTATTREAALLLLARQTEALRKDQLQRQQQLEQSSQAEPKAAPSEK